MAMRPSSEVMTCGFDRWEETMQHMIRECHQLAHRVPIVVAWMVTKTPASELWLRRPGGVVYQTRQ